MAQELSIFEMGVEDTQQVEEKAKATPAVSSVGKKPKKEEPFFVTGEWTVHFATERFLVTDFVDEIPTEGVTLDTLREGIERSFPQFSKARTKWDKDVEKKQLYPDAFAGSKGALSRFEPQVFKNLEDARNSSDYNRYILSGDGKVMTIKKSVFGEMIAEAKNIPSIPVIEPQFTWSLPLIPNKMLRQIIGFFKSYCENKEYEVALRIYWDIEKEKYVIEVPKQTVTATRIDLEYVEPEFKGANVTRYIPVLEVHSHNVMRPFFSETDNEDEQSYCVYGVFGRLDREQIETTFRVKVGDDFVLVKMEQIFEVGFDRLDFSYPRHWKNNVVMKEGF